MIATKITSLTIIRCSWTPKLMIQPCGRPQATHNTQNIVNMLMVGQLEIMRRRVLLRPWHHSLAKSVDSTTRQNLPPKQRLTLKVYNNERFDIIVMLCRGRPPFVKYQPLVLHDQRKLWSVRVPLGGLICAAKEHQVGYGTVCAPQRRNGSDWPLRRQRQIQQGDCDRALQYWTITAITDHPTCTPYMYNYIMVKSNWIWRSPLSQRVVCSCDGLANGWNGV